MSAPEGKLSNPLNSKMSKPGTFPGHLASLQVLSPKFTLVVERK